MEFFRETAIFVFALEKKIPRLRKRGGDGDIERTIFNVTIE